MVIYLCRHLPMYPKKIILAQGKHFFTLHPPRERGKNMMLAMFMVLFYQFIQQKYSFSFVKKSGGQDA